MATNAEREARIQANPGDREADAGEEHRYCEVSE